MYRFKILLSQLGVDLQAQLSWYGAKYLSASFPTPLLVIVAEVLNPPLLLSTSATSGTLPCCGAIVLIARMDMNTRELFE